MDLWKTFAHSMYRDDRLSFIYLFIHSFVYCKALSAFYSVFIVHLKITYRLKGPMRDELCSVMNDLNKVPGYKIQGK